VAWKPTGLHAARQIRAAAMATIGREMKPAAEERASRPTLAADSAAVFRARRLDLGLTKKGLAHAAGLSGAYVQQLEAGYLENPLRAARAALAHELDMDPHVLFANFPTPRRDAVAEWRRHVLALYNEGRSQPEIAALLGIKTVASDLKKSPGYMPRLTYSSFDPPPGRINAQAAAIKHGLTLKTLCGAIDEKIVNGTRHELGGRLHPVWTVDPEQLEHDLANLPECGHDGCSRPALAPGGGCCGPHSRAIETRGKSWRTREAIEKTKSGEAWCSASRCR
jgi:hypothetical protein